MTKAKRPTIHELDIVPLTSVGPLRFGMTRQRVKNQLGQPESEEDDDIMGEIRLRWPAITCYFEPKTLRAVEVKSPVAVRIRGVDVFAKKQLLNALAKMDRNYDDGGEYANFPNLGVCLGGFGNRRIREGKVIIAYDKGRADYYRNFVRV